MFINHILYRFIFMLILVGIVLPETTILADTGCGETDKSEAKDDKPVETFDALLFASKSTFHIRSGKHLSGLPVYSLHATASTVEMYA